MLAKLKVNLLKKKFAPEDKILGLKSIQLMIRYFSGKAQSEIVNMLKIYFRIEFCFDLQNSRKINFPSYLN